MIITISGKPGSGKSTVGRMIAERIGFRFYSVGDIRGRIAVKRGITLEELNRIAAEDDTLDREQDMHIEELGREEDNFVIDGRMAFHFIPHSLKVFLDVDIEVSAERVFSDIRDDEERCSSVDEMAERLKSRQSSDQKRYLRYYGLDYLDTGNYDIVIDTSGKAVEDIVDMIIDNIRRK